MDPLQQQNQNSDPAPPQPEVGNGTPEPIELTPEQFMDKPAPAKEAGAYASEQTIPNLQQTTPAPKQPSQTSSIQHSDTQKPQQPSSAEIFAKAAATQDVYREPILPKESKPKQESVPFKQPAPPPKGTPPEVNVSSLQTLRTFESDVAEAVERQKASVVKIALAEQKRKRQDRLAEVPKTASRSILYVFTSVLLVAAGIGVLAYFFVSLPTPSAPVAPIADRTIIASDAHTEQNIQNEPRENLSRVIREAADSAGSGVTSIQLKTGENSAISSQDLMRALSPRAPSSLIRNLKEEYMVGALHTDSSTPFIILTTTSFESAFAAMLEWETVMTDDLLLLFNGTAAPTSTTPFEDLLLRNKDIRLTKDEFGNTVIAYVFLDKTTIAITDSVDILEQIITRYSTTARQR